MPEDKDLIDRKRLRRRLSNLEKMCDCPGIDWDELDRVIDTLPIVDAVVLPCKLGDKIYQTDGIRIYESTIGEITLTTRYSIFVTENIAFDERAIGKIVFLTREEAEAALAKMDGDQNETQ